MIPWEVIFDLTKSQDKINELEKEILKEDFWKDKANSNRTLKALKRLKKSVEPFNKISKEMDEIKELLTITEKDDASSLAHLNEELTILKSDIDSFEFKCLLNKEEDILSAIVSINAGAGGTEACDWTEMLYRMYAKWADKKKFTIQRIDYLPGEEAGIKNVTFIIDRKSVV